MHNEYDKDGLMSHDNDKDGPAWNTIKIDKHSLRVYGLGKNRNRGLGKDRLQSKL